MIINLNERVQAGASRATGCDTVESGAEVVEAREVDPTAGEVSRLDRIRPAADKPATPRLDIVDWDEVFRAPVSGDALVDGLLLPRRWTAIIAPAKVGKSTLALHIATNLCMGFDPWTGNPITPVNVLYIDGEMGRGDVAERLNALGLTKGDLMHLHYVDDIPKCDALPGSQDLVDTAIHLRVGVVILDGLNAVISGDENDSGPWRNLFEHTISPLKSAGIAIMSNDNMGKDPKRGGRGSSVKLDKADALVELVQTHNGVKLKVIKSRTASIRDQTLTVVGLDGSTPIAYRRTAASCPPGTEEAVATLDRLGIPSTAGRDAARAQLKAHGEPGLRNDVLAAAIRWRKQSGTV